MPANQNQPFEVLETAETLDTGFDPNEPFEILETSETLETPKPEVSKFLQPLSEFNQKIEGLQEPLVDFFRNLRIPIVSAIGEQAGALGAAGIETAVEALGFEGSLPGEQTFLSAREKFLEQDKKEREAAMTRSPLASTLGEAVGAMTLPTPFGAAKGIGGVAKRILTEGGISLADKVAMDESEKALPEAGFATAVQTGMEALPAALKIGGKVIKKFGKAYEKAIPISGTIMSGGSADEIKELMAATPAQRKQANLQSTVDFDHKATDLKNLLAEAADRPNEEFEILYGKLNKEFQNNLHPSDVKAIGHAEKFVDPTKKSDLERILIRNDKLYDRFTKKVFGSIQEILKRGGPEAANIKKFSTLAKEARKLKNLDDFTSPKQLKKSVDAMKEIKRRMVKAKRQANEIKRTKEWGNLSLTDQRFITALGADVDQGIKAFSSGDKILDMDNIFHNYSMNVKDTFKKITTNNEIDEVKFVNLIKGNSNTQRVMRRNLEKFNKFLKDTPELQSSFDDVVKAVNEFKKEKRIFELVHKLKTTTGGPTSQDVKSAIAINVAMSNPRALIFFPAYNPLAYMRMKDFVTSQLPKAKPLLDKVESFYAKGGRERIQRFITESVTPEAPEAPKEPTK
jgi:hypothetical protein